ncbi:hypothetical protein H311_00353 [Anncaliia algerae PRA109]|nr:hypothetical protein H311_00353 [Anncaliia algerae PRA109]
MKNLKNIIPYFLIIFFVLDMKPKIKTFKTIGQIRNNGILNAKLLSKQWKTN